jgi:hypothetical protein
LFIFLLPSPRSLILLITDSQACPWLSGFCVDISNLLSSRMHFCPLFCHVLPSLLSIWPSWPKLPSPVHFYYIVIIFSASICLVHSFSRSTSFADGFVGSLSQVSSPMITWSTLAIISASLAQYLWCYGMPLTIFLSRFVLFCLFYHFPVLHLLFGISSLVHLLLLSFCGGLDLCAPTHHIVASSSHLSMVFKISSAGNAVPETVFTTHKSRYGIPLSFCPV